MHTVKYDIDTYVREDKHIRMVFSTAVCIQDKCDLQWSVFVYWLCTERVSLDKFMD